MNSLPHNKIKVGSIINAGSLSCNINSITSATNLDSTYYTVLCDATGGVFTVTLPTAVGISGRIYNIKKIDSTGNVVTVDGTASETIDGSLTKLLNLYNESITIQSNGTNWYII